MDRQPFLLQKLTQRLLGRREIDVGDDIKIANAIADEVLVDFPTTIRQEEILVDFPDKSNGNYAADDDEDDDDCDEDGFLGFPEGGRKPVVAREWQTPNSHRKDTSQQLPLPTSIEIPIRNQSDSLFYSQKGTNQCDSRSYNWVEAGEKSDEPQSWIDSSYDQEYGEPERPPQMLVDFSHRFETINYDHVDKHDVLSKVVSCDKPGERTSWVDDNDSDSHHEAKLTVAIDDTLDQFERPSNWIDDDESESDEDSDTCRQRILSMIAAKTVASQSPEPLSESVPGHHLGDSVQVTQQIPPERPGAQRCSRRSSMPANINCSVSLPSFGSSPFSKGFDFAKNISVPQQERRRPSMVNITYDFEKGLEARPRYERSKSLSKYASADSNLIGGLKAFGAKDHDIRRLLA
jgi:hypothetical protein